MRNKFQAQDRSGWQGFFAFEVAKIVAQVQLHISSFCKYATRGRVSKQKKRSRRRRRRRDGFVLKVNKVLLLRSMSSHLVSTSLPSTMKRRGTNIPSPGTKRKNNRRKQTSLIRCQLGHANV